MKFLKKKGVRIGAIVAAALLLVLIIYFCVRPVSVGYSYTGTTKNLLGKEETSTYHFDTFDKVTINDTQYWYFEKDGVVVTSLLPAENVKEADWKDYKESVLDAWDKEADPQINAFNAEILGVEYTCVGAIVTVVIMSVVELGLVAVIVLSCMGKKKKRK